MALLPPWPPMGLNYANVSLDSFREAAPTGLVGGVANRDDAVVVPRLEYDFGKSLQRRCCSRLVEVAECQSVRHAIFGVLSSKSISLLFCEAWDLIIHSVSDLGQFLK